MSRFVRIATASVVFAALVALLPSATVVGRSVAQTPACTVNVDKTAAPDDLLLGQTTIVTLKVDGSCPAREQQADVILAIDHSESMGTNNKLQAAQNAAISFVNRMNPALVRIGIVSVSRTAPVIQPLTTDTATLTAAINNLRLERGTNIVAGLDSSRSELTGPNARAGARKVIVFLTDGKHTVASPAIGDLPPVIAAVRAAGIEVFAIGLGSDADAGVLGQIASDPSHYFFSPTTAELDGIYVQIAGRTQAAVLFALSTITDVVPSNMVYIVGSAAPLQPVVDAVTRTLLWSVNGVPAPGYTITYQVRPTQVGTWPTNVRARLEYVDGFANAGALAFPVPRVRVAAPAPSCVCRIVQRLVPPAAVAHAVANPARYDGWQVRLDPNKPAGPANPPRDCLTLWNANLPYDATWNSLRWQVGCP